MPRTSSGTKKETIKKTNNSSKGKTSPKKVVSKKKIEKDIKIKPQNYLYALLILVGGILLAVYVFSWYKVKREEELMTSYLISTNTIESNLKDLDSLNQIRQEAPSSYFIYLSYTEDKEVYDLEKELKRLIDKYKLNDIFYYVNLTDMKKNNKNYLEEIESKLNIKDIKKIPAIIYVHEGKILERNILDGVRDTKFKAADLEQLLDIYDFEMVK